MSMIRTESIRYDVLRNGAEYAEIFSSGGSTLRMDGNGEIKTSLQGTFLAAAIDTRGNEAEINWFTDEIRPVLIVDGVKKPLGVFLVSKVTPREDRGKKTLEIQAFDRSWIVRDTKVEGALFLSAGTRYIDAIEGLLTSSGIGMIIKTPSSAVLGEDRADWETGTSYLEIINELLGEINYKQLWFDSSGSAVIEPASVPRAENIKHVFTNKKTDPKNPKEVGLISVHPVISRETDVYQSPNVFICVCSNADKDAPMVATAENTNPQSPLSIMRRGRRIVKVERLNNIASQEELEAYANRILFESMTTGETITVETGLLPGFGVNDVSALDYADNTTGICIEKAWSMQLTPGGKMTHTLEKVVLNIG